jgi:hypothetical protein
MTITRWEAGESMRRVHAVAYRKALDALDAVNDEVRKPPTGR